MIFVDEARIFVKAGSGGKGCESFHKEKYMRHPRPNGGDGGPGGDVIVVADRHVQTLLDFKYRQHHKGKNGGHGGSRGKKGREGQSCFVRVPQGTIIRDFDSGLLIKDLVDDQQSVTVARGGKCGRGNANNKIPTPPGIGEERTITFELKLIADVGIIGFPNAGKSTLISSISKVRSKIANYPFTTKSPILGFVHMDDFEFVIADLPGIIEGAHQGKGLGDRFLRHAERTKILIHMVDMAGTEDRDPVDDYHKIRTELESYSEKLMVKHSLIVANKMDLPGASENYERFCKSVHEPVLAISSQEQTGLDELKSNLKDLLCLENSPEE